MRGQRILTTFVLTLILIVSAGGVSIETNNLEMQKQIQNSGTESQNNTSEVTHEIYSEIPTWNVGDKWTYFTELNAATALPDNPDWDDADLSELLTGNTLIEISEFSTYDYQGTSVPVYLRTYSGTYGGPAVFPTPDGVDLLLETISGTLFVEYQRTEYIRASDLAILEIIGDIRIEFDHSFGTETLIDTETSVKHIPAYEFFDFPISLNESWSSFHTIEESWNGNNGYFDVPSPSSEAEYVFEIVENGTPKHSFEGCEEAVNISNKNTDGEQIEWLWYCENTRSPTHWWIRDIAVNVDAELTLIEFLPSENIPQNSATLELDETFERLNATLSDIVNITIRVTDNAGAPLPGMSGKLNYCSQSINWTTDENGTVLIALDIGVLKDDTVTLYDWGSHGVVIWSGTNISVSATTVVLNSSAVAEAIALRNEGSNLIKKSSIPALELLRTFDETMRW